ncbi:5-formyltetrahydrofolate cyclo-ligase [Cellvibrio sp. UBA7671]|jgi:5-formyltetrahydrofolate cyclo-ligase|uniref:5-formyltetrahydrofolate cyclo-ligase n=1 Tax=Cellvibrio sp. UBA7671 TaxID=1946312 RepID=UPI002F359B3F
MADSFDSQYDQPLNHLALTKKQLRNELRARRHALNPTQQLQASMFLLRHLMKLPQFMRARNVALYMANDGEIDPEPIIRQLWKMEKHCFLPVLRPDKRKDLWFVEYTPDAPLTKNRFGIPEPDFRSQHRMSAQLLDVVLMPLVGFDRTGARLGMGGGFYDATFAFKQKKLTGKPVLIGLAHACQQVDALATDTWDIPLFAIATDKEIILTQT